MTLVERIVALHRALEAASLPHAFGGALALAWCTQRARGTVDIDVNLFVDSDEFRAFEAASPEGITISDRDREAIAADGQVRLWWDTTPVDVFCNTTPFHEAASERVRNEAFGGADVAFLACRDLAVFKAFFDRTKDWADLEEMQAAGTLDVPVVLGTITEYLGAGDHRIERLRSLSSP
jgi:hypothetical protein